jgi:hypothetical protein
MGSMADLEEEKLSLAGRRTLNPILRHIFRADRRSYTFARIIRHLPNAATSRTSAVILHLNIGILKKAGSSRRLPLHPSHHLSTKKIKPDMKFPVSLTLLFALGASAKVHSRNNNGAVNRELLPLAC